MNDRVKVSETFYSIQGEGAMIGTPAVFLRLSGCGFHCSFCDTVEVWKKGDWKTIEELDALFEMQNYYKKFKKGAHLVLTGGDPMLYQEPLALFFERMAEFGREPERLFVEVETQASIMPIPSFAKWVRQWNVSPKLSNSGMSLEKRVRPEVLAYHGASNSCFKFPVQTTDDLKEVHEIIHAANIKRSRVYLMPICSTREEHREMSLKVAEMCKLSGFKFSPRLQLEIWDKATGV